jgi:hypothetical protein
LKIKKRATQAECQVRWGPWFPKPLQKGILFLEILLLGCAGVRTLFLPEIPTGTVDYWDGIPAEFMMIKSK